MRVHLRALTILLALAFVFPASTSAQTDSAGVRVVNNPAPRPNGPTFKLSAKPLASIGAVEGAPPYMLYLAQQGFVLGDGRIVIANRGTQEIRFYDKAGKHLSSIGRKGQGPGEAMNLGLVAVFADDSLVTSDVNLKRFQVFDKNGKYVNGFPAPKELGILYQTPGVLANGTFVEMETVVVMGHEDNGRFRPDQAINLISADGSSVKTFGRFPGAELSTVPAMILPITFGRSLFAEARGDRIAVATNDAYSIRIYDGSGKLLQIIRQARTPVAVKAGDFDRASAPPPGSQMPEAARARMKPLYDQMYRHTTLPAFGGPGGASTSLRFDVAGDLWVQEYQAPWDTTTAWQAFSPAGVFMGRLDLPAKTTLLDVGPDWVLVSVVDELEVEHVVLHGMTKP